MLLAEFKAKRVGILGLGAEGQAARVALQEACPDQAVLLLDEMASPDQLTWQSTGDEVVIGPLSEMPLGELDILIKSPGVSLYRPELISARENGLTITSCTNIWFAEMALRAELGKPVPTLVAVTGTKGKSTTAGLIHHLLKAAGVATEIGGNFGSPLLSLKVPDADIVVVELSSYQAADFTGTADLAILVNLFQEHLDWHGSVANYHHDKLNLLRHSKRRLVNAANELAREKCRDLPATTWANTRSTVHAKKGAVYQADKVILGADRCALRGAHNLDNMAIALSAVQLLGFDPAQLAPTLESFRPLPHRLKLLDIKGSQRLWINDSIATTPEASLAALEAYKEVPACLLIGGFERGLDWRPFVQAILKDPPAAVICLPDSGYRVFSQLEETLVSPARGLHKVETLADACILASELMKPGEAILLSPGAPSFPCFRNFAERGDAFTRLARQIENTG